MAWLAQKTEAVTYAQYNICFDGVVPNHLLNGRSRVRIQLYGKYVYFAEMIEGLALHTTYTHLDLVEIVEQKVPGM